MRNNWWIAIIVVLVVTLGLFYIGGFGSIGDGNDGKNDANSDPLKTIRASRTFLDGRHFIDGVIDLPTPCHGLSVDITVTESYPEQVALNFNSSTTAEMCTQVVTSVQFSEEFEASGYAVIRAYWNGEPAKLEFVD